MKKIVLRTLLIFFLITFSSILYLSSVGIETTRFNNQIKKKITNFSKDLEIELNEVKLVLDPINFQFNTKTLGPKIKFRKQILEIESIQTQVSLNSIFKDSFPLKNLNISTKTIEVRKLISFIRSINRNPKLLILENFIKKGHLIADLKIEFDESGNVKNNYEINGFVKDGKIEFLEKYKFEKINFNFKIEEKASNFQEITFLYKGLNLVFEKITTQKIDNEIYVNGKLNNENLIVKEKFLEELLNTSNLKIKKMNIDSNNIFSFKLDKKFKIRDLKIKSKVKLNEAIVSNNLSLKSFFPEIKNQINFLDHDLEIDYQKNEFKIKGVGNLLVQKNKDKIEYVFLKKNKKINFDTSLIIDNNELLVDFLNYKKKMNLSLKFRLKEAKKIMEY